MFYVHAQRSKEARFSAQKELEKLCYLL